MKRTKKNNKLVSILVIAIVLLIVIIIAEWSIMRLSRNNLLKDIDNASSNGYEIEELPTIDLFKIPIDDYSDMVNRPLFNKGRRPIEIEESSDDAPLATGKFIQILIGIYGTEQGMTAIFKNNRARGDESKYSKVLVGEDVAGWKVEEIHSDHLVLSQGGGQQQIKLLKPRKKTMTKPRAKPKNRTDFKNKRQTLKNRAAGKEIN